MRAANLLVVVLLVLALLSPLVIGCSTSDAIDEPVYFRTIYSWDGAAWQQLGLGGGFESDPVFIASPAFTIAAADINSWDDHPAYTTGTHGVAGTIVGTSDAQDLTNKNITMNNDTYIKWKDSIGNVKFNLKLDSSNDFVIRNTAGYIRIQEDAPMEHVYFFGNTAGTGCYVTLRATDADAVNTTRDSPKLVLQTENWWGAASNYWKANIYHDLITAGASPKSQLKFDIANIDLLELEYNNGATKTYVSTDLTNIVGVPVYANNAAAIAGGLVAGDLYRTGDDPDLVCIVH